MYLNHISYLLYIKLVPVIYIYTYGSQKELNHLYFPLSEDKFKNQSPVLCYVSSWMELGKTCKEASYQHLLQNTAYAEWGMYFGKPASKSWVTLQMNIHSNILIVPAASVQEAAAFQCRIPGGIPVANRPEGLLQVTTERRWNTKKNPKIKLGSTFLLPWHGWCFSKWSFTLFCTTALLFCTLYQ